MVRIIFGSGIIKGAKSITGAKRTATSMLCYGCGDVIVTNGIETYVRYFWTSNNGKFGWEKWKKE